MAPPDDICITHNVDKCGDDSQKKKNPCSCLQIKSLFTLEYTITLFTGYATYYLDRNFKSFLGTYL